MAEVEEEEMVAEAEEEGKSTNHTSNKSDIIPISFPYQLIRPETNCPQS